MWAPMACQIAESPTPTRVAQMTSTSSTRCPCPSCQPGRALRACPVQQLGHVFGASNRVDALSTVFNGGVVDAERNHQPPVAAEQRTRAASAREPRCWSDTARPGCTGSAVDRPGGCGTLADRPTRRDRDRRYPTTKESPRKQTRRSLAIAAQLSRDSIGAGRSGQRPGHP